MGYKWNGQRLIAYRLFIEGTTTAVLSRHPKLCAEYRKWVTLTRQALQEIGGALPAISLNPPKNNNYSYIITNPPGVDPSDPLGWLARANSRPGPDDDPDLRIGMERQEQSGEENQDTPPAESDNGVRAVGWGEDNQGLLFN